VRFRAKNENGSITLDALLTDPAGTVSVAAGARLVVADALATRADVDWSATECETSPSGGITCRGTSARLKLAPLATPGSYSVDARVDRLAIQPPLAGPATVQLVIGTTVTGTIDCVPAGSGLRCP
jgi:hypothetical protein